MNCKRLTKSESLGFQTILQHQTFSVLTDVLAPFQSMQKYINICSDQLIFNKGSSSSSSSSSSSNLNLIKKAWFFSLVRFSPKLNISFYLRRLNSALISYTFNLKLTRNSIFAVFFFSPAATSFMDKHCLSLANIGSE